MLASVQGSMVHGSSGDDGDAGGDDVTVGDVDDGCKGGCGIGGAVTRLLPAEVLDVLVRLGATLAWACCA